MTDERNRRRCQPLPGGRAIVVSALVASLFAAVQLGCPRDAHSADQTATDSKAPSRDNFDIPWPTRDRDSIGEQMDREKLDKIIREHNKQHAQWMRQRQTYTELCNKLNKISTNLQSLQSRAESVGYTMNKIRGIIGDQNADNADVFAPPETPRWNQSLAKTYTLRTAELGRLNVKMTRTVNNFNDTLGKLDDNINKQKQTLSRAAELRGEWVRITRPFKLWNKQDLPIPLETSTRWILDNEFFAPAYLSRCIAEIHQKNYEKATEDIGMAIKRDPYWVELYALQAILGDRAGRQADVDKSFKVIRRVKKKPAFVETCDGIISAWHKNLDGAKSKLGAAAKHDPSDPAAPGELALLLVSYPKSELRDPAAAVEAATAACKAAAWNDWWSLDVLAVSYAASGDFDRAVACTHRAKEAAPDDVQQFLDERIASYKKKQVPSVAVGDI
jgi:tetratricopeptide (TPR) repeat protein